MAVRRCSHCREFKKLECFHRHQNKPLGVHNICKMCRSKIHYRNKAEGLGRFAETKQARGGWRGRPEVVSAWSIQDVSRGQREAALDDRLELVGLVVVAVDPGVGSDAQE